MPFIKITRPTFLSGEPADVDEVFEVDQGDADLVIGAGRAVLVDKPDDVQVDPPKKKAVKVNKKPKKEGDDEKTE